MEIIRHSIGDKVVALTNPKTKFCQQRIKGNVYIVNDVNYCNKCGCQTINIGVTSRCANVLCECGNLYKTNDLCWTRSELFAPINNLENIMEEAIANEDYELCKTLTEITYENNK